MADEQDLATKPVKPKITPDPLLLDPTKRGADPAVLAAKQEVEAEIDRVKQELINEQQAASRLRLDGLQSANLDKNTIRSLTDAGSFYDPKGHLPDRNDGKFFYQPDSANDEFHKALRSSTLDRTMGIKMSDTHGYISALYLPKDFMARIQANIVEAKTEAEEVPTPESNRRIELMEKAQKDMVEFLRAPGHEQGRMLSDNPVLAQFLNVWAKENVDPAQVDIGIKTMMNNLIPDGEWTPERFINHLSSNVPYDTLSLMRGLDIEDSVIKDLAEGAPKIARANEIYKFMLKSYENHPNDKRAVMEMAMHMLRNPNDAKLLDSKSDESILLLAKKLVARAGPSDLRRITQTFFKTEVIQHVQNGAGISGEVGFFSGGMAGSNILDETITLAALRPEVIEAIQNERNYPDFLRKESRDMTMKIAKDLFIPGDFDFHNQKQSITGLRDFVKYISTLAGAVSTGNIAKTEDTQLSRNILLRAMKGEFGDRKFSEQLRNEISDQQLAPALRDRQAIRGRSPQGNTFGFTPVLTVQAPNGRMDIIQPGSPSKDGMKQFLGMVHLDGVEGAIPIWGGRSVGPQEAFGGAAIVTSPSGKPLFTFYQDRVVDIHGRTIPVETITEDGEFVRDRRILDLVADIDDNEIVRGALHVAINALDMNLTAAQQDMVESAIPRKGALYKDDVEDGLKTVAKKISEVTGAGLLVGEGGISESDALSQLKVAMAHYRRGTQNENRSYADNVRTNTFNETYPNPGEDSWSRMYSQFVAVEGPALADQLGVIASDAGGGALDAVGFVGRLFQVGARIGGAGLQVSKTLVGQAAELTGLIEQRDDSHDLDVFEMSNDIKNILATIDLSSSLGDAATESSSLKTYRGMLGIPKVQEFYFARQALEEIGTEVSAPVGFGFDVLGAIFARKGFNSMQTRFFPTAAAKSQLKNLSNSLRTAIRKGDKDKIADLYREGFAVVESQKFNAALKGRAWTSAEREEFALMKKQFANGEITAQTSAARYDDLMSRVFAGTKIGKHLQETKAYWGGVTEASVMWQSFAMAKGLPGAINRSMNRIGDFASKFGAIPSAGMKALNDRLGMKLLGGVSPELRKSVSATMNGEVLALHKNEARHVVSFMRNAISKSKSGVKEFSVDEAGNFLKPVPVNLYGREVQMQSIAQMEEATRQIVGRYAGVLDQVSKGFKARQWRGGYPDMKEVEKKLLKDTFTDTITEKSGTDPMVKVAASEAPDFKEVVGESIANIAGSDAAKFFAAITVHKEMKPLIRALHRAAKKKGAKDLDVFVKRALTELPDSELRALLQAGEAGDKVDEMMGMVLELKDHGMMDELWNKTRAQTPESEAGFLLALKKAENQKAALDRHVERNPDASVDVRHNLKAAGETVKKSKSELEDFKEKNKDKTPAEIPNKQEIIDKARKREFDLLPKATDEAERRAIIESLVDDNRNVNTLDGIANSVAEDANQAAIMDMVSDLTGETLESLGNDKKLVAAIQAGNVDEAVDRAGSIATGKIVRKLRDDQGFSQKALGSRINNIAQASHLDGLVEQERAARASQGLQGPFPKDVQDKILGIYDATSTELPSISQTPRAVQARVDRAALRKPLAEDTLALVKAAVNAGSTTPSELMSLADQELALGAEDLAAGIRKEAGRLIEKNETAASKSEAQLQAKEKKELEAKKLKAELGLSLEEISSLNPLQRAEFYAENVGDIQRGAPEDAMLAVQRKVTGEVFNLVEDVGDLTHRMADSNTLDNMGAEAIEEKLNKIATKKLIENPDAIAKSHLNSRKSNAMFAFKEKNDLDLDLRGEARKAQEAGILKDPKFIAFKERSDADIDARLSKYSQEHRKIPVFNRPQELAREAAIQLGQKDFEGAAESLKELKQIFDQGVDEWIKAARSFDQDIAKRNPGFRLKAGDVAPEKGFVSPLFGIEAELPSAAYEPGGDATAPFSFDDAATEGGAKLLQAMKDDALSTGKKRVGLRSLVEFVNDFVNVRMLVGKTQTTKKHPAHLMGGPTERLRPQVVRTRSGSWQLNLHEAGHGLSAFIKDTVPGWYDTVERDLIALAQMKGSYASAKTAEEGMAEFVRRYIVDYGTLADPLIKKVESLIREFDPVILDSMKDANKAYTFHRVRTIFDQAQTLSGDKGPSRKFSEVLTDAWSSFLYNAVGGTQTLHKIKADVWRDIAGLSQASKLDLFGVYGLAKEFVNEQAKVNADIARGFEKQLKGSSADIDNAYHSTLRIPAESSLALYGDKDVKNGIRIIANGDNFGHVTDDEVEELAKFGVTVPEDKKRGEFLYLHDKSYYDIKDAIGAKDWDKFEMYGQYKAGLHRFNTEGHEYPGMRDGLTPKKLGKFLKDMERENPDWFTQFKEIEKFSNQLLLLPLASGEKSAAEIIRIASKWVDYWMLPRQVEDGVANVAPVRAGAGGTGLKGAKGSPLPFISMDEAMETRVKLFVSSYYDNRLMIAMRNFTLAAGDLVGAGFEARKNALRLMIPLEVESKIAVTLSETELRDISADGMNRMVAEAFGVSVSQLPPDKLLKGEDIAVSFPGRPVWRSQKPNAVHVAVLFEDGKKKYYQITSPHLFNLVSKSAQPKKYLGLLATSLTSIIAPWKRALTQNVVFAIANALSRDVGTAMLLGDVKGSLLPYYYSSIGLVNKITGAVKIESMHGELYSRVLDFTSSKDHKVATSSFYKMLSEGVTVPNWSEQSIGTKIARLPGQVMATIMKPIDILNYVSGGRLAANFSEEISREGAFVSAIRKGYSPEEAQRNYDQITGNFGQRQGDATVASFVRSAGFLNPGIQIWGQTWEKFTHPDPQQRAFNIGARLPLISLWSAIGSALSILSISLFRSEEEKEFIFEEMRNRKDEDRMRYMAVHGKIRLPFDYGIVGAASSYGWNTVEGILLKDPVKAEAMARAILKRATDLPGLADAINPHIKTYLELKQGPQGYSVFYDDQIVPGWMVAQYPFNPELRSYPSTPEIFKSIGKGIGVSPIKVEYAVRNIFTRQLTDTLKFIDARNKDKPLEGAELPLVARLFHRDAIGFNSDPVETLSTLDAQWNVVDGELDFLIENGNDPVEEKELRAKRKELANAHDAMKEIKGLFKQVKDERNKAKPDFAKAKALERKMTQRSKEFLEDSKAFWPHGRTEEIAKNAQALIRRKPLVRSIFQSKEDFEKLRQRVIDNRSDAIIWFNERGFTSDQIIDSFDEVQKASRNRMITGSSIANRSRLRSKINELLDKPEEN